MSDIDDDEDSLSFYLKNKEKDNDKDSEEIEKEKELDIEKEKKEEEEILNRYEKIGNLTDIKSIKESEMTKNYDDKGNKYYNEYQFLKILGKGSFSKVKLGLHLPTRQKVAIKILDQEKIVDETDIERIKREIRILSISLVIILAAAVLSFSIFFLRSIFNRFWNDIQVKKLL